MRGAVLVALCGCNQIFGLHDTRTHDAAPPDVAFTCPTPGQGTVPTFTLMPVDVEPSQTCTAYITSERQDFALADCCPVRQGQPDHVLASSTFVGTTNDCSTWSKPRLAPEGNAAIFVKQNAGVAVDFELLTYDGANWGNAQPLSGITLGTYDSVGAPSRWAMQPHVLARNATDGSFEEFACTGTSCTPVQHISIASLGLATNVATVGGASLTSDGLRMVFFGIVQGQTGAAHIYYADRMSISGTFVTAQIINIPAAPPQTVNPYLTADCGSLYYADSDGSIWVTHQ